MGEEQVKGHQDDLANQLALSKNPTQGSGKPW